VELSNTLVAANVAVRDKPVPRGFSPIPGGASTRLLGLIKASPQLKPMAESIRTSCFRLASVGALLAATTATDHFGPSPQYLRTASDRQDKEIPSAHDGTEGAQSRSYARIISIGPPSYDDSQSPEARSIVRCDVLRFRCNDFLT
jgi:hypothetical protein